MPISIPIPRFDSPSPLASLVGGAFQGYGTLQQMQQRQQQMAMQRQQMTTQQLEQQRQQQLLQALPQQLKTEQQQRTLQNQVLQHQLAAQNLSAEQLSHKYISSRLADLAAMPADQRSDEYQTMRKDMGKLGYDVNRLPATYDDHAQALTKVAAQKSPAASAYRQFEQKMILAEVNNRARIQAAQARAGGGPITPTVGGEIITPTGAPPTGAVAPTVGAPPTAPTAQPQIAPGIAAAVPGFAPTAPTAPPAAPTMAPATPPPVAPSPRAQAGIQITPTKTAEEAFEKGVGAAYSKALDTARVQAQKSDEVQTNIQTFLRNAPKIPTGTGPWTGHLARFSAFGQQAIKAQNALSLGLLAMQKFGRVTNKEMSIVQNATLNVLMDPAAYQRLAQQLSAVAQRNIQYYQFLTAAGNAGIRNVGQTDAIWHKFMQENRVIDPNTGQVNSQNIGNWQKYLTPTALKGELEIPVATPKDFVMPKTPTGGGK